MSFPYSVKTIANWLSNLNVPEEALYTYITSGPRELDVLKFCLEIYSKQVQEKCSSRICYIPTYLFDMLRTDQSDESWSKICSIFPYLLSIQADECQRETIHRIKDLEWMTINRSMYLRLLYVTLTTVDSYEILDTQFLLDVRKRIPDSNNPDRFFYGKSIIKEWFTRSKTQRKVLLEALIKKIDTICLMHIVPEILPTEFELFSNDFWSLTCERLSQGQLSKERDIIVSLIEGYVTRMCQNANIESVCDYMLGSTTDFCEFQRQWIHFRNLFTIVQEQQLHLVGPAIATLDTIKKLHLDWRLCVLKPLVNQKHASVAYPTLSYLLDAAPNLYEHKKLVPFLINGMNRNDSANHEPFYQKLELYVKTLNVEKCEILAESSAKCNWVPTAAFYFYRALLECPSLNLEALVPILKNLQRVPHKYIRDGCYEVIFEYFYNALSTGINFQKFIRIATVFCEYDFRYIFEMTQFVNKYFKDYESLKFIYEELVKSVQQNKVGGKLLMLLAIVRECGLTNRMPFTSLLDCSDKVTPIASDAMFSYLCKNDSKRAENHIERRLAEVESKDNIDHLIETVEYVKFAEGVKPAIVQKSEEIIANLNRGHVSKITLAIRILIHYYKDCEILQHLPNDVWFISAETCSSYIDILVKSSPVEGNEKRIRQLIENVTQTQPQQVINLLYTKLDLLVERYLVGHKELEDVFLSLLMQLTVIKKKDDQKVCIKGFLKAFLTYCDGFEIRDIWEDRLEALVTNNNAELIFLESVKKFCAKPSSFLKLLEQLTRFGTAYTKERSIEYTISNEIYTWGPLNLEYINGKELAVRLKALYILSKMPYIPDNFTPKTKYFPDSEDHMHWLRFTQRALVLFPSLSRATAEEVNSLHNRMLTFLVTITHHGSVRQLLQWLLIKVSLMEERYVRHIYETFQRNKDVVTVACSIIPIMYHVAVAKDARHAIKVVNMLSEATMGPNFKLRAYAQIVTSRLLSFKLKKHPSYVEYKSLHATLETAIKNNREGVEKVLKSDNQFIQFFHPDDCYHLDSIISDIPELNGVTPLEWDSLELVFIHDDELECGLLPFLSEKRQIKMPEKIPVAPNTNQEIIDYSPGQIQMKLTPALHGEQNWSHDVVLVASFITSASNLGGLARSCEIYGIRTMVVQDLAVVKSKDFQSLSMAADRWLDIRERKLDELEEYVAGMKGTGYRIIGAEQTSESVKLHEYKFPEKCVLVLGNEQQGIPATFLPNIDVCVEVNQFGLTRSLNVHVAGATFIWEYVRQRMQSPTG